VTGYFGGVKALPSNRPVRPGAVRSRRVSSGSGRTPDRTTLTDREKEVVFHLALDKPNKQISTILGISELTVKNHVQSILAVYKVRGRVGAVVKALVVGDLTIAELEEAYKREDQG
jgi:DNA-binding CsgD family transcriptional regulator